METKTIPTLKKRYEAQNAAEQAALRASVTAAAGISDETFYRYLNNPTQMRFRAVTAFCDYFDVLPHELLTPQEKAQA